MNVNDRIALEIGRARLAQIVAETQRDQALAERDEARAQLRALQPEEEPAPPDLRAVDEEPSPAGATLPA